MKDDSNIRALVKVLRAHVDVSLSSDKILRELLRFSLERFNVAGGNLTTFQFENTEFVLKYADCILQGAILYAKAAQDIVSKLDDSFVTPPLDDMMKTAVSNDLQQYNNRLYQLKEKFG